MAGSPINDVVTALGRTGRRRLLGVLLAGAVGVRFTGPTDALGERRRKRRRTVRRDAWCPNAVEVYDLRSNRGDRRFAQVFEARHRGQLVRAEVRVRKAEGSSGDWIVGIIPVDVEGRPTDQTILAQTTIPDSKVPAGDTFLRAAFARPVPVRESKEYAVFVSRPAANDLNPINREHNPCGGRLYSKLPEETTYSPTATPRDLVYAIYVKA